MQSSFTVQYLIYIYSFHLLFLNLNVWYCIFNDNKIILYRAIEQNTLVTEESEVLPAKALEILNSLEKVENINATLPNDSISNNTLASMDYKDGAPIIGSSSDRVTVNVQEGSHLLPGKHVDLVSKTDSCAAMGQRDALTLSPSICFRFCTFFLLLFNAFV